MRPASARFLRHPLAAGMLLSLLFALAGCSGGGGGSGSGGSSGGSSPPVMQSIEVTPTNAQAAAGTTAQLHATAIFQNGTHQDITAQATWASSNTAAATVASGGGSSGLASALATGNTTITAHASGMSGQATLAVTPAVLMSIGVTPIARTLAKGTTVQLTATGVFSDHSTQNLTSQVTWASSNPAVIALGAAGAAGLATASGVGSASVTARLNGITSPGAALTATAAALVSIQVTPASPSIANGLTQQFTATGTFTDNSKQDLTGAVVWASSDNSVANLSNTAGSSGLAAATSAGSIQVTASLGAISSPGVTLTVTTASLVSIQITPPAPSVANGTTQQFKATGLFTDNTSQDLTTAVTWASSNPGVAAVSNAAGSNGLGTATGAGSTTVSASLNGTLAPGVSLTVTPATLVSVQVTPPNPSLANGLSAQFAATGTYTDNTTQDLTAQATWASSDSSIASISNAAGSSGRATAAAVGTTSVTASFAGVSSAGVTLTVTAATLASIQVTPASPSVANGLTQQFTAIGVFTDNSTQDLTAAATWSSSNSAVMAVSSAAGSGGLGTALSQGTSNISASLGAVTSPASLCTVTAATLVAIQVTPASPTIASGLTQQFTATGIYSDNSTQDLTASVTWLSSSIAVASISSATGSSGLASAAQVGTTSISAVQGGVSSAAVPLTVTAATLVSIQVTPPSPSIANGLTQTFTATGVYTDNSTQDLTSAVTWMSSNTAVSTISNAAGSSGLATAATVGNTTVTATLGTVSSAPATLTVTAATLVAIQVTPPNASLASGLTQQYAATGIYTDNSTQDLTVAATWASSNPATAGISNVAGSNGLATAAAVGTSTITASVGAVTSAPVTLTVTAATLVSLQVTPANPSVASGMSAQFAATGLYTDNTIQDLSTAVTWFSSNPAVASISNAAGSNGLASAVSLGTSSISASYGALGSPGVTLTVTPAVLVSIQVTPTAASIASGLTQQFAATGTYSDNSTQDLTSAVTWSSSAAAATISNAAGSYGLATGAAVGSTNITAGLGAVNSAAATLTVSAATLVSIQVTPASASIMNGATQQFTAVGTFTDNSVQDLTTAVTWSSSAAAATISNAAGSYGLATAAAVGSTNISAGLGTVNSPAAALTVTTAVTGTTGLWSATPAAGVTAYMLADSAGDVFYYTMSATCTGLYDGTLTITGSSAAGAGYYAPDLFGPSGCTVAASHENFTGTVAPGATLSLTATPTAGGTPVTTSWTFDPTYNQSADLALLAGTWTMQDGATATISASGAITASDPITGCTITGQVTVSDPTVNLYTVSATYTGCSAAYADINGVDLTGLGTLDTSVTPTQFVAITRSVNKKTLALFDWVQ